MARFALAISIYEQQPYVSFAMSIAHDIPKRANSDFDSAVVTTKRGRINVDSPNYCLNSISCLVKLPCGAASWHCQLANEVAGSAVDCGIPAC
jgi:hypothetical protein